MLNSALQKDIYLPNNASIDTVTSRSDAQSTCTVYCGLGAAVITGDYMCGHVVLCMYLSSEL